MTMQVYFEYDGNNYSYTISDKDIDMTHYDEIWDYWVGGDENSNEKVFEITAHKIFTEDGKEIPSGKGIYINVYENIDSDEVIEIIDSEDIMVIYS